MIICTNCKFENPDSANFCNNCGSSLELVKNPPNGLSDTKKCPYCAEEIKADAIVCRFCGHDLRHEQVEEKPRKSLNTLNPYLGCLGLLIIGVVIIFALTNPKKSAHTNKIYSTLGESAGQQLAGNTGGLLGKLLGQTVGTISNWLDVSLFEYHNYIVFSTTSLNGRVITMGYLSNVRVITSVEEWISDISTLISNLPSSQIYTNGQDYTTESNYPSESDVLATLPSCSIMETIDVPFTGGIYAVQTVNRYSGKVIITASGIGQASANQNSDAFYVYTDNYGNAITPSTGGFVLRINGQLAVEQIVDKQLPTYRSDHVYRFRINGNGNQLTFGVSDIGVGDNSGSYRIELCQP